MSVLATQPRSVVLATVNGVEQIETQPADIVQATTETIPWACDFTNYIAGTSETPTSPVVTLTDVTNPAAPAGVGGLPSPTVSGNQVLQSIPGSVLTAAHKYRLVFTATLATGLVMTAMVNLQCPL